MSFSEWKKYKLGEVAELRKEQVKPGGKEQVYIGLEHIEQQTLRLNGVGSSSDVISNKFKFYSGDVLYGKLRPYFRKVYQPKFEGVCSTDIYVIKNKDGFDKSFIFYLAATEEFTHIANSGSTGTRMPRADWGQLELSEWAFPDLQTQQRIASILSSLDDKIALNRQTNQTLEAMAQTLFKEWFGNFNYPNADGNFKKSELGEIPEKWEVKGIGAISYVQNGFAFKGKDFQDQGEAAIIKIKNISGNVVDIQNTDFVDASVVSSLDEKFKIKSGSLLIAMTGAEVGKIGFVPYTHKNLWLNQRVGMFRENIPFGNSYIYLLLATDTYQTVIQNSALGSAQPNISASAIESICAIIPPSDLIEAFGKMVQPMFEMMLRNLAENETLSNIRDSILPKLMTGEMELYA